MHQVVACNGGQITGDTQEIQILPRGWVKSTQGDFLVDDEAVRLIMEAFAQRKNDIVLDYEHQTLTGQEAPAAGWIVALHDRPEGIFATVEWTKKAAERLKEREYRYFSPVVLVRKSDKRAVRLHSGALTNDPAIDGMIPIAAKSQIINKEDNLMDTTTTPVTQTTLLESLIKLLELPEDATEEQVVEAVEALVAKPEVEVAVEEVLEELGVNKNATLAEVKGAILALKNPAGKVSAAEYQALKRRLDERDRDELVAQALASGKITPAQKGWAEHYALKDPEGFKAFIKQAPQVVPLSEIATGATVTAPETLEDDDIQLSINRQLGISDEQWKSWKKSQQK